MRGGRRYALTHGLNRGDKFQCTCSAHQVAVKRLGGADGYLLGEVSKYILDGTGFDYVANPGAGACPPASGCVIWDASVVLP